MITNISSSIEQTFESVLNSNEAFLFFRFFYDWREILPIFFLLVVTIASEFGWRRIFIPSLGIFIGGALAFVVDALNLFKLAGPNLTGFQFNAERCRDLICSDIWQLPLTSVVAASFLSLVFNKRNIYWAMPVLLSIAASRLYFGTESLTQVLLDSLIGGLTGLIVFIAYLQIEIKSKKEEIKT